MKKYFYKMMGRTALLLSITVLLHAPIVHAQKTDIAKSNVPVQKEVTFFIGNEEESFTFEDGQFAAWFTVDTWLENEDGYRSELENVTRYERCITVHPLCKNMSSMRTGTHLRKKQEVIVRTNDIERFMTRLAENIKKEPINARFRMKDNRVVAFRVHQSGHELDVQKSVAVIERYASSILIGQYPDSIKLPATIIAPEFTADNVNDLGIDTLIGEGRSNFAGSPTKRIHNIKVAAAKFDGVILAPGDELSFVDLLGPVDATTGYAKELVIKDKKTLPEYGGGICQVSTTLFRSAIFTGLEITQRRNHSYPVKYYEPIGFDATIYIPAPNLKFKNNTPRHILIHNFIEGTELVFQVFGTSDGRSVDMKGPFITEKNPDGSMKTYFTQTVTAADGDVLIDDIFRSNYKSPKDYPIQSDLSPS